ncbi:MAG: GAF domain-containing protein [Bacteroidales bacterium]|nr:GAF domain-containing protein [Bacteroidales bacterium]
MFADNHIGLIDPLTGVLENTIHDIFSLICEFEGVDHGGIFRFNRGESEPVLICHRNLHDELLTGMIRFNHDSRKGDVIQPDLTGFDCFQKIPLHVKIAFEQCGTHAIALIPLIYYGQVVGCMNLGSKHDEIATGFEKLIIEELTWRISRTIALQLALARLSDANQELTDFMQTINSGYGLLISSPETEIKLDHKFGMKHEISELNNTITLAIEKVMKELGNGLRNRELPFNQKKVDMLVSDADHIVHIISQIRVFGQRHSETIENDLRQIKNRLCELKGKPSLNMEFSAGNYLLLERPITLKDLNFRTDRLIPN